jgi:hypothetical protein
MSGGEMNRLRRLIGTNVAGRKALRARVVLAGALVLAAAGLSGCISDPFNTATDPAAPSAAEISRVGAHPGAYPHWSQFPKAPQNVPTPAMFAQTAHGLDQVQAQQLADIANLQWDLDADPEAWAASQRRMIDPAMAVPAPPGTEEAIEAWAAQQRALAVPPPRIK